MWQPSKPLNLSIYLLLIAALLENPVRLASVLANFGSGVTVHVGVTVHRNIIGIKSDLDDLSLNLW
ncbi:hypothetical protein SLEP1_g42344 [Rubroshorea leprosula]|uniref:Uncharacterized protein n=1 Tax=Rubroshorea leprosula TaxID=152421 RepID=A0AAV5L9Y0_9ROSI|nr:hypothetical protein SLEP1_g42344 [Rubroshorea leprosula]